MSAMTDFQEVEIRKGTFRSHGITAWAATTNYSIGDRVYATNVSGPFVFEVTADAGSSGGSEPTWNTGLGATTTDGGITWTCYHVGSLKRPLYVALFTTSTSDAGGGTEVSGGSYARVQVDPADANWSAPDGTGGLTDNVNTITFPTATANWGTITHVALFDKATGGNMLFHGALSASQAVNTGGIFKFNSGDLDITHA